MTDLSPQGQRILGEGASTCHVAFFIGKVTEALQCVALRVASTDLMADRQ